MAENYLRLTSLEDNNAIALTQVGSPDAISLQYRTDLNLEWQAYTIGTQLTLFKDSWIEFRNTSGKFSKNGSNYYKFTSTKQFNASGRIGSLLFYSQELITATVDYAFYRLFHNCTTLVDASELEMNVQTAANYCYAYMFNGCTSLTEAPELPAMNLANNCYLNMFNGCTSLTEAPELPATTLATYCYSNMFQGCTSLTTPPALPATTLYQSCYQNMFQGCTALATAPELPATTTVNRCYSYMFDGCISLTQAPELPATTLDERSYQNMFQNCSSLTSTPDLPATTLANYCYANMFQNCTSLTKAPNLPATTLAERCCNAMFQNCTSLTKAPDLPATTLATYCYSSMFQGCTSLTTAPELPATTLAGNCYQAMFRDCTSLTQAPDLLATTLANGCYASIFFGCTSLTQAPELPATTLVSNCYSSMFRDCTNLNRLIWKPKTIPSSTYCNNWLSNASASGTFEYTWPLLDVASIPRTVSGVPEGWSIQLLKPQTGIALKINNVDIKKAMLSSKNIAKLFINGVKVKSQAAIGTDIELPSQYTKLLYVDSNGGYLDTGVPTNGDLKVGIKWSKTKAGLSTWPELFGNSTVQGRTGDYYKAFSLILNSNGAGTSFGAHYNFLHGLYSPTEQTYGGKVDILESDPNLSDTVNEFWLSPYEFSWNGQVFNILDYANQYGMREHNDWEYQPERLNTSNMFLFSTKTGSRDGIINCYNFYIVDTSTETVLLNYVPCKLGSLVGFYDSVTQTFVTNTSFIAGPVA